MSEGGTLAASNKTYLTQAIALVMAITMIFFGIFSSPLFSFVRNAVFYSL
jgi:hypothetical protein